jgi:MFS family permease
MHEASPPATLRSALTLTVVVGALGYFVDIFDLLLFPIVRQPSLLAIGVPEARLLDVGAALLQWQMWGMLIGGIFWGVLGDKKGRRSVLFGSIALYSAANILNAFVDHYGQYAALRFLAGFGLAGELGAAITLVSETLSKEARAYGTMIVATVGVSGAVVGGLVARLLDWQTAYIVGGVLGLFLLLLRIGVGESGMFDAVRSNDAVERGNFFQLFTSGERFARYVRCILIGTPLWYGVGILITFAPEFAPHLGVRGEIDSAVSVALCYAGLTLGDFSSGFLSQRLASRKKVVGLYIGLTTICIVLYCTVEGLSSTAFYGLCAVLGFALGYWAVFVTVASEQFGTNLRATVTTTVPNFVRGSLVPIAALFNLAREHMAITHAALAVGLGTVALAALALVGMRETHGRDLDFVE